MIKIRIKTTICAAVLCFSALFTLAAVEVNEPELRETIDAEAITFINYEGPHNSIDAMNEIRGIGTALGSAAQNGVAGERGRYYIIHAVDSSSANGFDADILILGERAAVDHIRNLRAIISAYLSEAYGYSVNDANTLATFVTIYNAVYRGRLDVFRARYKPVVTQHLTQDRVGLSTRWDEWPGQTQIVIPLSDPSLTGTISSIDTTVITDEAVVESMRESDDRGIDDRKEMIDLKEREADAAEQRAEETKKDIVVRERTIVQQKQEVAKQEQEIAREEQQTQRTPQEQQALEEKKAAVEEQKQSIARQEEAVARQKEQVRQDEAFAEQKREEVQSDRESVSEDQTQLIEEENARQIASATTVNGLRLSNEANMLCEIVALDRSTGAETQKSPINTIRGRSVYAADNAFIAIAGTKTNGGAIRLVQIDQTSLDVIKQGNDDIAENSVLTEANGLYYAVTETNGTYKLGKFDKNLNLINSSQITVNPSTPITVSGDAVLVQDAYGTLVILNVSDLKTKIAQSGAASQQSVNPNANAR